MLTGRARTLATTTLAILITFGASGCFALTETPEPSASATPSASPLFASDEEALAAATEAYAAYLRVSDEILADGGRDPGRLLEVASSDVAASESEALREFVENNWRSSGSSTFDSVRLQSRTGDRDSGETVVLYLCVDASDVDVVDQSGISVVSPSRIARTPLEVAFTRVADSPLVVTAKSVWTGANFCEQ